MRNEDHRKNQCAVIRHQSYEVTAPITPKSGFTIAARRICMCNLSLAVQASAARGDAGGYGTCNEPQVAAHECAYRPINAGQ